MSGNNFEDVADPRGHATRLLVRQLTEAGGLGEGMLVVDQMPSNVAPEVVKSTSLKIVHLTAEKDDRNSVTGSMLLDGYAHEDLARLTAGEAFLNHGNLYRPIRIQCHNLIGNLERPSNHKLLELISNTPWFKEAQKNRIDRLAETLDRILHELRTLFVAFTRLQRTGKNRLVHALQKKVLKAAADAKQKMEHILAAAMLDKSAKDKITALGVEYKKRMKCLLETAGRVIAEGEKYGTAK